jgi:hypothetical protein
MVKMLGFPIKFAAAPCLLRRPAPEIGGDTDAVLQELGYAGDFILQVARGDSGNEVELARHNRGLVLSYLDATAREVTGSK